MEELQELCKDLEDRIEHLENGEHDLQNEFHEGFQEGYSYGLQHILEKLQEILENQE